MKHNERPQLKSEHLTMYTKYIIPSLLQHFDFSSPSFVWIFPFFLVRI